MEENNQSSIAPIAPANGGASFSGASFINPEAIISQLDFKPGMKIADFGCGTGYFVFPLAKKVGSEGKLYALDIVKEKLEAVESQAKLMGLSNVSCLRVNLELENGSKLEEGSMDWVLLINMLFENSDEGKVKILEETKRVLKTGGKILIIEWQDKDLPLGPAKNLRVGKESLQNTLNEIGLGSFQELPIGGYHYGLIVDKK